MCPLDGDLNVRVGVDGNDGGGFPLLLFTLLVPLFFSCFSLLSLLRELVQVSLLSLLR